MASKEELNNEKMSAKNRKKKIADNQKFIADQQAMIDAGKSQLEIMATGNVHLAEREKLSNTLVQAQNNLTKAQKETNQLLSEAAEEAEKVADSQAKWGKTLGALNGLLDFGVGLLEEQSNLTRNTANTLGVSVTEAVKMNEEFAAVVKNGKMQLTTIGETAEVYKELEQAFGNTSVFTAEMAADTAILSKRLGTSAESTVEMTKNLMLSDAMTKEQADNTLLLAKNLADASNVKFSSVMADAASSGKDFMNYFGKSTKEMLKMAVAARKMGFELNDMVSMSKSLLDIEGSIEAQMKFNMITGKNINMDKARQLMLEGKSADALKEIQSQVGDTSELGILEREALDEMLGGNLQKLEQAQQMSEIATEDQEKEQQALADMDGMNEKRAREVELANEAVTSYEKGLNSQKNIKETLMAQNAEKVEGNNLALIAVQIQGALAAVSAVVAVLEIFGSFAKIPFGVGLALAGLAVAGMFMAMRAASQQAQAVEDAMIDPEGGLMVSGPKGTFQLDKDDSIIAGTELDTPASDNESGQTIVQQQIDLSPLLSKIDQLISAVQGSKSVSVDGYQMNEALHLEKIPSGMV